ncbi:C-14 reductase [Phaffia rhodozyma]|uniref:Delta(14)-sterol reductase ERG24 n=1 Tax=Phaffia rhodozyma TaxID=264483 RepID=A0A0F7SXJ7_PHARH|nr:C-14 reductase [Phaffia rhodozyma]
MADIDSKDTKVLNPVTPHHDLEFGGHIGTFGLNFITPFAIYFLYFTTSAHSGCPPPLSTWFGRFLAGSWLDELFDAQAFKAYAAWYAFTVACWYILPGEWVEGAAMRDGKKKLYKLNGFSTLLLSLGLVLGRIIHAGPQSFTFIYDHYLGLITASLAMSIAQALYCQAVSYWNTDERLMALAGNSGRFFYDFWMGRELNPSIGSFDIKTFNELRPGLILWMIIDISMACEQYTRDGYLAASMILVVVFHSIYVIDALYNETAIFTQMDITTDGFGFMLSLGDLAWVPFTYSLQARYLAFHPTELSTLAVLAIIGLEVGGYYIFRAANLEKEWFRAGKNPRNLTSMKTERGTALLTSGWWGRSRHPNYLGDWTMAWAWCLPTGFDTPFTYFYVIYFAILLVHRQRRDDDACKKKYGKDWDRYCEIVKSRIIPYLVSFFPLLT